MKRYALLSNDLWKTQKKETIFRHISFPITLLKNYAFMRALTSIQPPPFSQSIPLDLKYCVACPLLPPLKQQNKIGCFNSRISASRSTTSFKGILIDPATFPPLNSSRVRTSTIVYSIWFNLNYLCKITSFAPTVLSYKLHMWKIILPRLWIFKSL